MLIINGNDGGGQILRSALALSCLTGTPVTVRRIRGQRDRPGLLRQHLCSVRAAAEVSEASVTGDELGSQEVVFRPGVVRGGSYHFAVGSAGSAGLVLQTVLLPLLFAEQPSELIIEGGTHNHQAPCADFLLESYLPALRAMGGQVELQVERHGFFPAGGGVYRVTVTPCAGLSPLERVERRGEVALSAEMVGAKLPSKVIRRLRGALARELEVESEAIAQRTVDSPGPGGAVVLRAAWDGGQEVFTGFARRGITSEYIARSVVREAQHFLRRGTPVGEHLSDQLLLLLALGGGRFRGPGVSEHDRTHLLLIDRFFPGRLRCDEDADGVVWSALLP